MYFDQPKPIVVEISASVKASRLRRLASLGLDRSLHPDELGSYGWSISEKKYPFLGGGGHFKVAAEADISILR